MSFGYHVYRDLYFTTCSVHKKYAALKSLIRKKIVLDRFSFIVHEKRAVIYAFVIMDNHFHILWEILEPFTLKKVQHSLLSYSAKVVLANIEDAERSKYLVFKQDREYQLWKTNSLSVEIYSQKFLEQKMNYIHDNPRRAGLVNDNDDYLFSSWASYQRGESEFDFLTLW